MLRKWWEYIKAWFRGTSNRVMDPAVEMQMAIDQAKQQDRNLRNQAANIVAHRTQLEGRIEKEADTVGETREMAKQALMKAEEARAKGDTAGVDKWTTTAQSLALKLQAAENNLTSLTQQYEVAIGQAEEAKRAVQQNATRLQELSAKQIELMGALEQAKMQEQVNQAVQVMSATLDDEMPSLASVEEKIEKRKAQAMAKAEIYEATPQGAEAELRQAINETAADAKLEELKAELGLTTGGTTETGDATGLEA
jgi:phage shock protein A